MKHFLSIAHKYTDLIIDLCAEQDVMSRPKLLNYMERYRIEPGEKDTVIRELCSASILREETDNLYTVNSVVVSLVNYYERRGQLTHAGFLREQVHQIGKLADEFQRQLYNEETPIHTLSDTLDSLRLMVSEVREAGAGHYMACMRRFGDMKRTSESKTLEHRLEELETVQRRYINPLRELIDPSAEYSRKISLLKRSISDLSARPEILARSREMDISRRQILLNVQYIDHELLRNFVIVADTAHSLLKSLIKEKNIRDAIAACLGNLDFTWQYMEEKTLVASGIQAVQAPGRDNIQAFFTDVVLKKLLPNPRPLKKSDVRLQNADLMIIRDTDVQNCLSGKRTIQSWPAYVVSTFAGYSENEQLKAIALPLINRMKGIRINNQPGDFIHKFKTFTVRMTDFGLTEESESNEQSGGKKSEHLSETASRLSVQ
ncbi:MAG: hypothetical protein AB7S75_03900 [Desulfococcaceae bacterium]